LGLGASAALLVVGFLLLGGVPLIRSSGGQAAGSSTATAASPHAEPLAGASYPSSLAGINGTVWEDSSGGTCADCTYSVFLEPTSKPSIYFLAIWYLTDSSCPPAVRTELVNLDVGANGTMVNDLPAYTNMELCTRATNPVVQDCGQNQIWFVNNFTLTVTQTSISGEYQSQYWTWDTAADGAITNCSIEYNYEQSFSLTPVFSSTSVSSTSTSTSTSQQNAGNSNLPIVQTSSSSTTTSSSTSTVTSSHSGGSGRLGVYILTAAAAVLLVAGAVSWVALRKRLKSPSVSTGAILSRIQSPPNR
jgi:hypothetical protein